ncbi:Gal83p KNAG_0E01590 [Huiozyma naganishii CBS 8797]|uniref:Association with the SNF1 complex (ASC) domain-containing protein n=1 Tax=Huiozyma naganishii (strain ATCC MYA-139 / BCRC 22969 / CBS 8797 / KCTC 17520 / NBRC 10181 / NCYC 3082 / Yp74L-3) TaxID=1071383 RepID=J7S7N0_HUIN7|nr:hypothetical protein KNAG_0E01590 [Kazachstania naganishii CBS 8797]CCK70421.1 hypothetical protein KNAG_0E01590 [Kazachstania naganishii CBS 8797]
MEDMENKDHSMLDVNDAADEQSSGTVPNNNTASLTKSFSEMNVDEANEIEPQLMVGRQRSRSTLIFDDEDEIPPYADHHEHISDSDNESTVSSSTSESGSSTMDPAKDEQLVDQAAMEVSGGNVANDRMVDPQQQQQQSSSKQSSGNVMVPVDIIWQQGGTKAYVTGSFTGWRKMIGLVPLPGKPSVLHVKLQLPPGTHKFRFIVDNELRFSDYLPTATDQMGNFVNYLEVVAPPAAPQLGQTQNEINDQQWNDEQMGLPAQDRDTATYPSATRKTPMSARSRIAFEIEQEPDDMGGGYTRFHDETPSKPSLVFTRDIPAVFTDPAVMEQYYLTLDQQQNNHQNMAWLTPPQLPPHLENVILNSYSSLQGESNENNSGALPIPNHVILNHLATSSIKHNTLCVASIVRYKQKYATQILYAPLQ